MVSGFYGAPKRLMLQTRLESVEEESFSGGSVSGRRRKKEVRVEGCRMPGQRASKQDNNRKPTVPCFIPNHTPRSGLSPAHSSSPHTPLLPALSISLSELNERMLSFEVGKKGRWQTPALYSSWWINWINNRQLGANLQSMCDITEWWMQCVTLNPHLDVTELTGDAN